MDVMSPPHAEGGVYRLLQIMIDVGATAELAQRDHPYERASEAHRKLFDEYVPLLQQGYDEAVPWWEGTVRAQSSGAEIDQDALDEAYDIRMAGPAADPRIVWILRLVWMRCDRLNHADPSNAIRPEYLMVQWLVDAGKSDLARLLSCMPYWPIGLDADGNWS